MVMLFLKTQPSPPTILSVLATPWMGPVQVALIVGAACHCTWSWLVLWFTGWTVVSCLFGLGHCLVEQRRRHAIERVLADEDYELSIVAPQAIPCLASAEVRQLLGNAVEDPSRVLIFVAAGKTRSARLEFTTRCLVGDNDFPTLLLVSEIPRSAEAQFEILHELGHSNNHALHAEFLILLDPLYAILVVAIAATLVEQTVWFEAWCALWLAARLFFWMLVRLPGIECEVIADCFAYDVVHAHDPSLACVQPFAEGWSLRAMSRKGNLAKRLQSRARLRCLNARRTGRRLPVGPVQYSPLGLLATIAMVVGTLFCMDNAWRAVIACAIITSTFWGLCLGMMWLEDRAQLRLKSRLIHRSKKP